MTTTRRPRWACVLIALIAGLVQLVADPAPVFAWSMISHTRARWLEPLRATVRDLARARGW